MANEIRIKKGLDIQLMGRAEKRVQVAPLASMYGIKPADFHFVTPKLLVKEGAEVQAGEAIFHDKKDERILFASPVSGTITDIVRGERRKILEIKIRPTQTQIFKTFETKDPQKMSRDEIKKYLLAAGAWAFIKQRPYDVVAAPDQTPKAIFISACKTNPLAPDYSFLFNGKKAYLQAAVTALSKLTDGKLHISLFKDDTTSLFRDLKDVTIWNVSGPHPAGNVSTQIAHIDPINKGEVVWVVSPQDLLVIGELFQTGKLNISRSVALSGSQFLSPKYLVMQAGAQLSDLLSKELKEGNTRIISGDVLTGKKVCQKEGFLGYYDDQLTAIPEGDDYELFGWNKPVFNKVSTTRALTFSWLSPNKKYDLNTNTNGEHRAFVMTGMYEEVFPLDIYPMQLLKACLYKDLDELENLGAYEIAPEDFALTEFVCVSKQPHQKIIREGLDLMMQELG